MKRSLIALALASLLPLAAQADDRLSYSYIEGDYVERDADGGLDADGFGVRGSFELGASGMYTFAGYARTDVDGLSEDADGHEFGIGYHRGITPDADLLAEIAHQRTDFGPVKIDGFRTSVGMRGSLTDSFEGLVKANYYNGSDYSGDFTGTIGAQYKLTQTWGVTGEAEFGNGNKNYLVGVRASF